MRRPFESFDRPFAHRGALGGILILAAAGAVTTGGCGDDEEPASTSGTGASGASTSSSSSSASSASSGASGGEGGIGTGGVGPGGSGGAGGGEAGCTTTAASATRGSAVAISADDSLIVAANRDAGTVSVIAVDYTDGLPKLTKKAEVAVGGEPWQVAIDGCGSRAYVVLRKDQKVVELTDLAGTPTKGLEAAVGSEPTAIAITPNNTGLYVANWVDGTISVLATADLSVTSTIDLNAVLAETGLLGPTVTSATARPALAHPRSLAITNDGDADDTDEKIYVTEFFAQRTEAEASPSAANADFNWEGLLYAIEASSGAVGTVSLSAFTNTGFKDVNAADTGCFPNQLQSVTVEGTRAYVTSICASPRGPVNVFQKKACTSNTQCTDAGSTCDLAVGSCTLSCTTDADCGFGGPGACTASGACKTVPQNVKTLTHPVVHVIDTATDAEVRKDNLNLVLQTAFDEDAAADDNSGARRFPLVVNDLAFRPGTTDAYVSANGADAAFRLLYAGTDLDAGAGAGKRFIDLGATAVPEALRGRGPIGIAVAHAQPFAFTLNDVTQNVSAIDLDPAKQAVAGSDKDDARAVQSADLPTDAAALSRLHGKGFFNTGLDRWSLKGQAWGACQVCHFEGLSDNITWYFARGPRQSNSLDGSFASNDATDQRIFNWTGVFDEVHDFENVARGLLGGVGALVSVANTPPSNADRINLASAAALPPAGAVNLNGSAEAVGATSAVKSWDDVRAWITQVRAPRAPSNLVAADVTAGKALFEAAKCDGCHGGAKWTLSRRFYTPSGDTNAALLVKTWDGAALTAAGFPAALLPAAANQLMRGPMPVAPAVAPAGSLDQILCVMRPVGTFGISPVDVNALELRQDMAAVAQGNEANGKGYNVPSLLGMQLGAPYFHAGNARTLEELASTIFAAHHGALNATFAPTAGEVAQLTAFILSIDEDTVPYGLAATAGANGGTFCSAP